MKETTSPAPSAIMSNDAQLPVLMPPARTLWPVPSEGGGRTEPDGQQAHAFGLAALLEPASGAASRSEGPQADHKLIRSFVADAQSKGLCSDKTLSHHVTALNALSRWLAAPAQRQRLAGGLRSLLQNMSRGHAEAASVAAVLREFRRSNPSADVKRRTNYAFNALCKVTGAGAVVSESSFLDVSIEDAAVIRRFRRAAQSTPGNNAKTLANISVALKHLGKWLAPRGMDLSTLQHSTDDTMVLSVVEQFRKDPAVPEAAKTRTGAAVKALRSSVCGTVLLSTRQRWIGEEMSLPTP